jgi:hypothetical protein
VKKGAVTNECTSVAGHFDSHTDELKQYGAHCPMPMQPDQRFTGSHWMPPLGNYSLHIVPTAAREGNNQQNDDATCTHFAGRFDGHHNVAVQYCVHPPMEEVHGFHKSH